MFAVLGALLLTLVNVLSRRGTRIEAEDIINRRSDGGISVVPDPTASPVPGAVALVSTEVSEAAARQLLLWSAVGLAVTVLLAVGVGWWTAVRVLRPVQAMTESARRISVRNLHERIGATGPADELKELGDTLDGLLERLERAFESQRRFIANASHELRTPLATQRTAIQLGMEKGASPAELARTKELMLRANRRSEHLIDGLLVLARSERGLAERQPVDLAALVEAECARHQGVLRVLSPCQVWGNSTLLARLTANLLANAVAYNREEDSWVRVTVHGDGVLTVTNPGPTVHESEVEALFEPFRRGASRDRTGTGSGLGLSIVRSIALAHGGKVSAVSGPPAEGGLIVTVHFNPVAPPPTEF
ncbi:sensor histidine kinase [Streptomyces sp. NPDC098789]|uniref:sensor histidine kinase n=1 Tax=Streptomyces sp. NPDC098789 TaxID=3366098 RepID=UPI0037F3625C